MKKKHILLSTESEPNIAVIEIPKFAKIQDEEIVEKINLALEEHFDQEVEIHSLKIDANVPILGHAEVSFIEEGVEMAFTVNINETWVY